MDFTELFLGNGKEFGVLDFQKDKGISIDALLSAGKKVFGKSERPEIKDEKALENTYSRILNLALNESAVSDGLFFDLMYANRPANGFNTDKLYAFMRKSGNEVLLVVTNFSDEDIDCKVCLPRHVFDYFGLPEKAVEAADLFSDGETLSVNLVADGFVSMSVPANGGRAYKFII